MTRQEFLDALARALRSELTDHEVIDNVRYYDDYIDREISSGKSEAQVLEALGDPRLIARTIRQVDQQREEMQEQDYDTEKTVYTEDGEGSCEEGYFSSGNPFDRRIRVHTFGGIKAWLILLLVLAVVCFVLGTVFAILWKLLPVILLLVGISWLYKRFFS